MHKIKSAGLYTKETREAMTVDCSLRYVNNVADAMQAYLRLLRILMYLYLVKLIQKCDTSRLLRKKRQLKTVYIPEVKCQ